MTFKIFAAAQLLALAAFVGKSQQAGVPTPPRAAGPQAAAADHVLEDGVPVKLRLSTALSSERAEVGQEIAFEVEDDIDVDGVTVLRRGTPAMGVVTEAVARKRLGRPGKLNFRIDYVPLADGEKARLRAVTNSQGDSRTDGMVGLMVNMPLASAPFFLLIKGGESAFPKGTELTAFIDGDMRLDLTKFGTEQARSGEPSSKVALSIESTPDGAEIEIDGTPVGKAPLIIQVAPGIHRVAIRKKGFAEWNANVEVGNAAAHVNAVLREPGGR